MASLKIAFQPEKKKNPPNILDTYQNYHYNECIIMIIMKQEVLRMAQTERITFLATKEFKKWLESEAKKSGMSISELIRLRCESGSCEEELLLRGLFNEVKAAVKKATASLDKGLKDADDTIRELRKNRELRKKSDLEK